MTPSPKSVRERARAEARRLLAHYGDDRERAFNDVAQRHRRRLDAIKARFSDRQGAWQNYYSQARYNATVHADPEIAFYVAVERAFRYLELEAARTAAKRSSLPDFARLAWLASFTGQRGAEALIVLQDALHERYGAEFDEAMRTARRRARRTGDTYVVTFGPTVERALRAYMPRGPALPFAVGRAPWRLRRTVPVVWDTLGGQDVHDWAEVRRAIEQGGRIRDREALAYSDYWRRETRRQSGTL